MKNTETIRYIIQNRCSVARFGDGEFFLMMNERGIGFQEKSAALGLKLDAVLHNHSPNLLICVPHCFNSVIGRTKESKSFWLNWGITDRRQERIVGHLRNNCGRNYIFGDAQITRPYIAFRNRANGDDVFPLLSKIWSGRNILIVEGIQTRMGVGNDLFANAATIRRVLAPPTNAFSKYEEILSVVLKYANEDSLILLALGPTATVLAEELSRHNFQALDLGHLDLEYEWFTRRSINRELIDGKYVNELQKGNLVADCSDPAYLEEIVATIA